VLQAADILLHRATHVPVGDDQRQHLEFARECATNFNHAYGGGSSSSGKKEQQQLLVPPATLLAPARRVMSLRDPRQKMSKSALDPASRILLTDTPAEVRKKIQGALTDSVPGVSYDPETRPGVSNLLEMLSVFEGGGGGRGGGGGGGGGADGSEKPTTTSPAALARDMAASGATLRDLKARTADAVVRGLEGIGERYREMRDGAGGRRLEEVERMGAEKARASAEETMKIVRSAVGFD